MQRFAFIILVSALVLSAAAPADADRYWALMRDGEFRQGERLRRLQGADRLAELDDKPLLDTEHPVRTIRDTQHTPLTPESFVEMTNGDVLVGRVAEAVVGTSAFPLPDHLIVTDVPHTGNVRVRLECIRRLVRSSKSTGIWNPGSLRLADGRRIAARSIRWSKTDLMVLTDDKALSFPFDEIAELQLAPSLWQTIQPGSVWWKDETLPVARVVSANGQIITFPKTMVTREYNRKQFGRPAYETDMLATKPAWSLDPLLVDANAVAWQSFFAADETPLTTLPVVEVQQEPALGAATWRRNESIHGDVLLSGDTFSELGLGMHSHTRVAFQLPPHAKTFSTWVGLDRGVGSGGCVHCRIWRNEPTGTPLWERKYLTGADGVQGIDALDIGGARRLILEVDFAHEGRPANSDPLDIRDMVNWLMPVVHVEPARDMGTLTHLIPEIKGWSIDPEQLQRISLRPFWLRDDRWSIAIDTGEAPLALSLQVHVTMDNAWLPVRATCDDMGDNRTIWVRANDTRVESDGRGNITTFSRARFGERGYSLRPFIGKTVVVEVIADPYRKAEGELGGVVWDWLRLQPPD